MTEIGFQYAVGALRKKHAELAGEIGTLSLQLRDRRRDLAKVADMIQILAPGSDPSKIPPKKAIRYLNLFRQGELGALIMAVLRTEKRPMSNIEVARAIFDRGGFDAKLWTCIRRRVRGNLAYLQTQGTVGKVGNGPTCLWKTADLRTSWP